MVDHSCLLWGLHKSLVLRHHLFFYFLMNDNKKTCLFEDHNCSMICLVTASEFVIDLKRFPISPYLLSIIRMEEIFPPFEHLDVFSLFWLDICTVNIISFGVSMLSFVSHFLFFLAWMVNISLLFLQINSLHLW